MSTHNIGFYEDLTKIIFELSSNIIKYTPYFFCWLISSKLNRSSYETAHGCTLACTTIKITGLCNIQRFLTLVEIIIFR